jgi:hypothetical protein
MLALPRPLSKSTVLALEAPLEKNEQRISESVITFRPRPSWLKTPPSPLP